MNKNVIILLVILFTYYLCTQGTQAMLDTQEKLTVKQAKVEQFQTTVREKQAVPIAQSDTAKKEEEAKKVAEPTTMQQLESEKQASDIVQREIQTFGAKLDSLQFQIMIVYVLMLALLVTCGGVLFLLLKQKKSFRDNILNLLDKEKKTILVELVELVEKIVKKIQPAKINENELETLIICIVKQTLKQIKQNQQNNKESKVHFSTPVQPQSLYADSVFEGIFNCVNEQPDDDTIFELKLNNPDDTVAKVIVYAPAQKKVIANPSYLEGCEKQILGNTAVSTQREGIARKVGGGKWIITTPPEVKIS